MKVRFSLNGIVIEGIEKVPTVSKLCEIDKRLLYIGDFVDSKGNVINDAFLHVLKPTEFFTIKDTKFISEKTLLLNTEMHYFENYSSILGDLFNNHREEIYVGDVCDGSGTTGEVWHDTYKMGLSSNELYTKNEDGTHEKVEPPYENCFTVPDRYGFRLVLKTPNEPDKHYAFLYGISAFNQWQQLKYYAEEGQEVLHSLDPDYTKFLYSDECFEFEKYPELVKSYPKSYSRKGFLDINR